MVEAVPRRPRVVRRELILGRFRGKLVDEVI
jgi:hypothetical protein